MADKIGAAYVRPPPDGGLCSGQGPRPGRALGSAGESAAASWSTFAAAAASSRAGRTEEAGEYAERHCFMIRHRPARLELLGPAIGLRRAACGCPTTAKVARGAAGASQSRGRAT